MILQASENGRNVLELTVPENLVSGGYVQLTKFKDGYCTNCFGAKSHGYSEEIFIISGRIYGKAFEQWLGTGTYTSRPPGEVHEPFLPTVMFCLIMEVSCPRQSITKKLINHSKLKAYKRMDFPAPVSPVTTLIPCLKDKSSIFNNSQIFNT